MKTMLAFTRHILAMPVHWRLWIAGLFLTNTAAVLYLPRVEAVIVLTALIAGAMLQMTLFARFGFVRLLGVGHFHWLPLVVWLASRLDAIPSEGTFRGWVVAVMVLCGLSLAIDIVDVIRYFRGERQPTFLVRA